MKIKKLIAQLENLYKLHGDLEVVREYDRRNSDKYYFQLVQGLSYDDYAAGNDGIACPVLFSSNDLDKFIQIH